VNEKRLSFSDVCERQRASVVVCAQVFLIWQAGPETAAGNQKCSVADSYCLPLTQDALHVVSVQLLGVNLTSSVQTDYVISAETNVIQSAKTHESWTARVNMDSRLTATVQTRYKLCLLFHRQ